MKHITAGIVAHVDAGKTTLSEALLYEAGGLRHLGRVDKGDAFLDPDDLEKKRGITIFSHQAQLQFNDDLALTILDTPGHVDFAAQTEQVLSVLDYAILVISGTDGIQGYTRTLWRLLDRYQVPTFIFVNKMDATGADQARLLNELQTVFSPGCLAFPTAKVALPEATQEEIAMQDDTALEAFLENGQLTDETVQSLIKQRRVFPCYFGAALKMTGVADFLAGVAHWSTEMTPAADFGARVFKISHDEKGERLTWVRVTGGVLHNKAVVVNDEKVNQLRVYNGAKYDISQEIMAGGVCAMTGLTSTYPGQGLGNAADAVQPMIQPVLTYALDPQDNDVHACLSALRQLEDEDPQLHVSWSSQLQEIRVQLMGAVQLEILQQRLLDQFQLAVSFDAGSILYKESITAPMEGVGHFEPLRHYSEVHVLLRPAPRNSGLTIDADCSVDVLGKNWQHQVLSNLAAKTHRGVLTGAPLTDVQLTLVTGRSHIKHSEGGDFREATWRSVRQGLMMLRQRQACVLLEPWYQFRLEVPQDQVGRAMNDIQKMHGTFETPQVAPQNELTTVILGTAPVAGMQDYAQDVHAYTHGQGQLECIVDGYQPCHDADTVIDAVAYEPKADLENTPDSVFCAHGAGYPVDWDQVPQTAHVPYVYPQTLTAS